MVLGIRYWFNHAAKFSYSYCVEADFVSLPTDDRPLEAWLAEPTPLPKIQNEGTIRLLAGDLADDAELAASIAALRPQLDEMSGLIEQAEAAAASLPHRERYLRLNHALARDLIEALRRWTDRVEAELAPDGDGAADSAAPSGRQE